MATIDQSASASIKAPVASRTQPIRVLHVINGEHYSGAERVQDLLGLRLGEFGYEVGFACLKQGKFAAMRQALAAQVYDLSMRSRCDLRPVFRLVKLIRTHGYQIVHTHTARSALVGRLAAKWCGIPHVHHVHSPTSRDTTRWFTNRVNMVVEKLSLHGADRLIAVSHSLGDYVREQELGSDKLTVVPNGVPAHGPLAEHSTPSKTWVLGTVALFRPRKGLEVLLHALARLRSQGLAVRLRAVGSFETEEYEIEIKKLADELQLTSAIDWTGFTSNVPAELQKMDIFVLPSLFGEGLPMVILEAMASGVPVVATRIEGAPEAIRDSIDGLLAEAGNANELADRIADIVEGRIDWQSLRTSAHERQAQLFSDRSMAVGVAEVYRSLRGLAPFAVPGEQKVPVPLTASIALMGSRIENLTMPEAIAEIERRLDAPTRSHVAFVNADYINVTYRNAAYRQVLANADLVFADGIGMKIAGKVMGTPLRDNVNGTDLFPRLCAALASSGKRVYLLGGQSGIADKVAKWIETHAPGLTVCGTRDGYFRPQDEASVVAEIAASEPDLLLVALGVPRQEEFIARHLGEFGCQVAIGVGGLFDFYSGLRQRAPMWMRKSGLEWLYRMSLEPKRLAKRYLLGNPLFLCRVLRERCGSRRPVVVSYKSLDSKQVNLALEADDALVGV